MYAPHEDGGLILGSGSSTDDAYFSSYGDSTSSRRRICRSLSLRIRLGRRTHRRRNPQQRPPLRPRNNEPIQEKAPPPPLLPTPNLTIDNVVNPLPLTL